MRNQFELTFWGGVSVRYRKVELASKPTENWRKK